MNTAILPFPNPNSIPHSALNTPHSLGSTFPVPHSALPPRRTGKVARLPKAVRDRINHLLDENIPYHTIIAELGEAGQDLNPQNISNWAQGGYQDYLHHQDMLDLLKDQVEFAKDLLAQVPDPSAIFQALRLMAGVQLSRVLFESGQKLAETDPAAYARLVRTICSLSSAERQYCQARLTQAPVPSAPAKPIDYFRPLTERETQLIRAKLDEMCGYSDEPASPIKPDQASVPNTAATASLGADAQSLEFKVQSSTFEVQGSEPQPAATPIKPDQASAQPTAATTALGADAQNLEFKVQGSAFKVQGSPAQPELPSAQPAATPIKADQASAQPAAATTPLGADAQSPEFQVQSSTFEVQGSPAQPEQPPAHPTETPIKPDQASSVVEAAISAAATSAKTPGPR